MNELMNNIHEDAKLQGIDNVSIAAHIGTTPTSVTYYFDGTNHMNFGKFIRMVHLIYKSEYDDLIMKYCEYCDQFPKKKAQAVKEALDWSMGRWNSELTQYLLDLEKEYSPKTHEIYNLLFMSREGKLEPEDFFEKVHYLPYGLKTISNQQDPVIQVLIDLCNMYYYHFRKDYEGIYHLSKFTFKKIAKIKSEFLRYSYTICVNEMLTIYYIRCNKIEACKAAAETLIQENVKALFPLTYLYGLNVMSEIYVFTNYQTSLYYIERAIKEMETLNFSHYKRKYEGFKAHRDFTKIINGDYKGLYLNDEKERLHHLVMLGDDKSKIEADNIIKDIIKRGEELDEFHTCYQAILNKDIDLMFRSEEMFMEKKDFYYVKLVRKFIKEWRFKK